MQTDAPPPCSPRRHGAVPMPLVRQLTRGPLDDALDDPLSAPSPSPHHGLEDMPSKDFGFLQHPTAYHVLPATNLPPPFANAPHLPSVSSPIDSLLLSGHYRLAAIAAARNIVTAASPSDYSTLFYLLHLRLACLCLINEHALAAQESKIFGDLNSAFYRHPLTNAHIVPWHLRLLVVRLAALGYGEWRKGIMGYYELARECRQHMVKSTTSHHDKQLCAIRLRDCAIRVANVLVEMGDLAGASRHLATLSEARESSFTTTTNPQTRNILLMETLVRLRVGDIASARRCLAKASSPSSLPDDAALLDNTLAALILLADSEYDQAADAFTSLHQQFPDDAMVAQNLAVCLLYTGRIAQAKQILTTLANLSPPFHSLVFNLSTVFELCTEKNRDCKIDLASKLAARTSGDGVGWELNSAEFKL